MNDMKELKQMACASLQKSLLVQNEWPIKENGVRNAFTESQNGRGWKGPLWVI